MRVSVVVGGLDRTNARLQPWRYMGELAAGLARRGHAVEILTDVDRAHGAHIEGCTLRYVPAVRTRGPGGGAMRAALETSRPDVTVWHVGTTSVLHTHPPRSLPTRHVAVFTSPLYRPRDLARIRNEVLRAPGTYAMHVAGSLIPVPVLSHYLRRSFDRTIVLAPSTRAALTRRGMRAERITALPPGKDEDLHPLDGERQEGTCTFLYAGNPLPVRGTRVLVQAFAAARRRGVEARLVMLCRREQPRMEAQEQALRELASEEGLDAEIEIVGGVLPREEFLARVASADVMVLPFLLVPSEAPLLVLEAAGMGKPLIASEVAGIPDIAAAESVLVPPADVDRLAAAMAKLARDPVRRQAMTEAAIASFARYPTWDEVAAGAERVLLEAGA